MRHQQPAYETMKLQTKTFAITFSCVALLHFATGVAHAYYNPQTGRWLSRDPAGEPGFELLRSVGAVPRAASTDVAALPQGRWFNRDPLGETQRISATSALQPTLQADAEDEPAVRPGDARGSESSYGFIDNDPVNTVDCLGLLKFKACTADEQSKLSSQFPEYCNKMKRPE